MSEDINQMRIRHKCEIEQLQDSCKHKEISECMRYMWAPGHHSHCVKVCKFCGKEIYTTEMDVKFFPDKMPEYTRKSNGFDCSKRNDCIFWDRSME